MKKIVAVALVMSSLATTSAHALDFKLKDGSYISGGKINVSFTVTVFSF